MSAILRDGLPKLKWVMQAFRLPQKETPRFFKYLKIEFLSHYGAEHFCPVSLLRVYGRSQLEAFRDEEAARYAQELLLREMEEDRAEAEGDVIVDIRLSEVMSPSVKTIEHSSTAQPTSIGASTTVMPDIRLPTNIQSTSTSSPVTVSGASSPIVSTETNSESSLSSSEPLSRPSPPVLSSSSLMSNDTTSSVAAHESIASKAASSESIVSVTRPMRNETRLPQPSHASGGESVYGAIAKRISNVERDSSLTLKYIEEQAKFFQRLFGRLEAKLGDVEAAVSLSLGSKNRC